MLRTMLLSKIHRATVNQVDLNYVGSITIDSELLEAIGMKPFEKVEIFDIDNGNRFATYIIEGERGSGIIGINGAAARMVHKGDKVIIVNYGMLSEDEFKDYKPNVVVVDEENKIVEKF
jgi:aspartate 1-decarboxylase